MKTNRNGRECPQWCTRDHADPDMPSMCTGGKKTAGKPGGKSAEVGLVWLTGDDKPEVSAQLWDDTNLTGILYADSTYDAARLAGFLEAAADTPKPVLRQMAAHVREVAAVAYPEAEAG
jgi:hypothetical protein